MLNTKIIEKEIEEASRDLDLDLTGLCILTEIGSKLFALTPLIAVRANAKVYAVCQNSEYGSFKTLKKQTLLLAKALKIRTENLIILPKKDFHNYHQVDIVTNLGHVRPINKNIIEKLKDGAVISYMRESWEVRPDEFNFIACKEHKIKVFGINENFPLVDCFKESGLLALKMILDKGISPYRSRMTIISRDKFGPVIYKVLKKFSKEVFLIDKFPINKFQLKNLDILILADLLCKESIIGSEIDMHELTKLSPNVNIIIFCEKYHMNETLADASVRSFVRLQTGGLKVGELAFKKDYHIGKNNKYRKILQRIV